MPSQVWAARFKILKIVTSSPLRTIQRISRRTITFSFKLAVKSKARIQKIAKICMPASCRHKQNKPTRIWLWVQLWATGRMRGIMVRRFFRAKIFRIVMISSGILCRELGNRGKGRQGGRIKQISRWSCYRSKESVKNRKKKRNKINCWLKIIHLKAIKT